MYDLTKQSLVWPAVWLWPTRLALDAPLVAVTWQRFFASTYQSPSPLVVSGILALVVWGIYLADRYFDTADGRAIPPTDRHRFAQAYRRGFAVAAIVAFMTSSGLAVILLPVITRNLGVLLFLAIIVYMVVRQITQWKVGREMIVGFLFAFGVSLPLWETTGVSRLLPAIMAFGAICWLNCLLIEGWEAGQPRSGLGPLVLAMTTCLSVEPRVAQAILISLLLMILMNSFWKYLPLSLLRVLADVVLLTPLVV